MQVKINEGKIEIDYWELFENLGLVQKQVVAETLACDDDIIKHVADQLLGGWTENGYHGGKVGDANPSTPLDIARQRIALGCGDIAKETIEALQRALDSEKKMCQEYVRKYHDLQDGRVGI